MRERFRKVERACARLEGLRTAPISGLPEIGRIECPSRLQPTWVRGPSCFETHRSGAESYTHPHSLRAAMLLSMRANVVVGIFAKRSQPRFGQTKPRCGTNLRLWQMAAGSVPLFPDCYLQWRTQLERVSSKRPSACLFPARRFFGGGLYTVASISRANRAARGLD
jgi:hypothetical protein